MVDWTDTRVRQTRWAFGRRLHQLQIGRGLAAAALAETAGISPAQLEAIKAANPDVFDPGLGTLIRLALALGVDLSDLGAPPV
ncbi:MAG TPA: helix-turn-helix transcriptional regulator [Candidatus Dormibacteraeota bacterium]|nr:helix-turn-helix transcriptional regulator [Candidatus Dormibacteraeota bacterium]